MANDADQPWEDEESWLPPTTASGFQPSFPATPPPPPPPPRPAPRTPAPAPAPPPPPPPAPVPPVPVAPPAPPKPPQQHSWTTLPRPGEKPDQASTPSSGRSSTQLNSSWLPTPPPVTSSGPGPSRARRSAGTTKKKKKNRPWVPIVAIGTFIAFMNGVSWLGSDHHSDKDYLAALPGVISHNGEGSHYLRVTLSPDLTREQYARAFALTKERNQDYDGATLVIGKSQWSEVEDSGDIDRLAGLATTVAKLPSVATARASSYGKGIQFRATCTTDARCAEASRTLIVAAADSRGAWKDFGLASASYATVLSIQSDCQELPLDVMSRILAAPPAPVSGVAFTCAATYARPELWVAGRDGVEPTRKALAAAFTGESLNHSAVGWTDPTRDGARRWKFIGPGDATAAIALADAVAATGMEPRELPVDRRRIVVELPTGADVAAPGKLAGALEGTPVTYIAAYRPDSPTEQRTLFTGSPAQWSEGVADLMLLERAGFKPELRGGTNLALKPGEACGNPTLSCFDTVQLVKRFVGRAPKQTFGLRVNDETVELTAGRKAGMPLKKNPWLASFVTEWNRVT